MFFKSDPLEVVEGVFKKRNWKSTRMDDQTILTGVGLSPARVFLLSIRHEPERKTVVFLCNFLHGPAQAMQAVAAGQPPVLRVHRDAGYTSQQVSGVCELLLHLNFEMLLGSFERDNADGEIRFRVSLPYRDIRLSSEQVNWCIDIITISLDNGMRKMEELLGWKAAGAQPGGRLTV
jgi:hypothetical protein